MIQRKREYEKVLGKKVLIKRKYVFRKNILRLEKD